MLNLRRCKGLEISREPIRCAVSVHHRLAQKNSLTVQDLYGENLMLMRRDWSHYVDLLRDDLWKNHPQIHIVDFDFYDVAAFNQCENNNCVLMAVENWRYVHPLSKNPSGGLGIYDSFWTSAFSKSIFCRSGISPRGGKGGKTVDG